MNIHGTVGVRTAIKLQELAARISERLCGGVAFIGADDHLRGEVPALYCAQDLLGLRVVLYGEDGDFVVEVEQWRKQPLEDVSAEYIDLSKHIASLLVEIDDLQVQLVS